MNYAQTLKTATSLIESTFTDKMTVKRYIDTYDEHRTPVHKEEIIYTDIPCRISYSTQNNDNPNAKDTDNIPVAWKPLVFAKHDVVIEAGDEVTITCSYRNNATFKGKASDVCALETHIEFNIGIKTEA